MTEVFHTHYFVDCFELELVEAMVNKRKDIDVKRLTQGGENALKNHSFLPF